MIKNSINKPAYPTFSEFRRKNFLNITTAVGLCVSSAVISIEMDAEEKNAVESKKVNNSGQKKIKDEVILLVANLGHDNYKERDKATQSLIVFGKKFTKDKKPEMTEFLKTELKKSCNSKDPEVKERAKKILLAITPAPPRPPNRQIKGKIAPAGW